MKIFKFGGTSIRDVDSIKNVMRIISSCKESKLVIVFSAIGHTTNMLEDVVDSCFFSHSDLEAKINIVKDSHYHLLENLFNESNQVYHKVNDLFNQLQLIIRSEVNENYSYIYDQIVSFGEILSTTIMSAYLNDNGFLNETVDAREIIKTDDSYRNARINWKNTVRNIKKGIVKFPVIIQGFIGQDANNNVTTLGREGSDFTASILGFALKADEVIIWKDVEGVLNADPRFFNSTTLLRKISYNEAIELAFFGAKVMHPKTIQPLKDARIPLRVKSFINPRSEGTIIDDIKTPPQLTPCFIVKENQILISISDKNLSFIIETHLSKIFRTLDSLDIRVNLMQNSAVSFSICIDNDIHKTPRFINQLKSDFNVYYNENLYLYTIRHYDAESEKKILYGKKLFLQQKTRDNLQLVLGLID